MPSWLQAFRGCDKLQLPAILKVPRTMFGLKTMVVATLEFLEQNKQKSEWYSFCVHRATSSRVYRVRSDRLSPVCAGWVSVAALLGIAFFWPLRPVLPSQNGLGSPSVRRCLLCYGFVWYCYISCTSHRPVTASGLRQARSSFSSGGTSTGELGHEADPHGDWQGGP